METNFKILKITNCQHKDVNGTKVPVCSFSGRPSTVANELPPWARNQYGPTLPVRAFQSLAEMAKSGYGVPALIENGKPFQVPDVHPTVHVGAKVGQSHGLLPGTTVMARSDKV